MDKYEAYVIEDFVVDAEFQKWVRYPSMERNAFWEKYKQANPGQADDIRRARLLLGSVYARYNASIDEAEIEEEITALVSRIRNGQDAEEGAVVVRSAEYRYLFRWLAAAVVVIAGSWISWPFLFPSEKEEPGQLVVERMLIERNNTSSSSETIVLEDSSVVVLEPGSQLRMPQHFENEKREVFLTGEAFFKISRDVKRPFFVYSDKLITRVLGTSFTVRSRKGAEAVEVKEGKVYVFKTSDFKEEGLNNESNGRIVTSNQKITFETKDDRLVKTLSDSPKIVLPKAGNIRSSYVNTPVSDVLKELRNAYQVDIIFDEELLSGCPLTATLSDQPLKEKLAIICEAIEAKYEILDGQIMIYGKSCN